MRFKSNLLFAFLFLAFIGIAFSFAGKSLYSTKKTGASVRAANVSPLKTKDYEKLWARVDSLQNRGLYASALELSDKIMNYATADNLPVQVVKAVIFKMKFNSYIKEEDYIVSISELEKISSKATFPLKQIVHSVTAEVYYGYYQRNRYRFYSRSTTVEFKNEDISTWDLKTLSGKVIQEYLLSLTDENLSKQSKMEEYKDLLQYYSEDGKKIKPTLYDFLARRAYDFFAGNEFDVTRPAEKFTLTDAAFLQSRDKFLQHSFTSTDTFSCKLYATKIIGDLLRFHANDQDLSALVYTDLERLSFVRRNSGLTEKDSLYFEALKALSNDVKNHEAWAEVQYYIASYRCELASKYNAFAGDKFRWEYKNAMDLLNEGIKRYPKSYGAQLCEAKKTEIEDKTINFTINDVLVPNQPSLAMVSTKNMNKVWFRIVNVGYNYDRGDNYYEKEKYIKKILALKPIHTFSINLKNENDYQAHNTDFKLPGLASGEYLIISSANAEFTLPKNHIGYSQFKVSDISYIDAKDNTKGTVEYLVLSRSTGQPLAGAKLTQILYEYDSKSYRYKKRNGKTYTADENGKITVEAPTSYYRYFYPDISYKNDRLVSDLQAYQNAPYGKNNYQHITTYYFTDRKIYRPGQTVYFKGIQVMTIDGENPTLVTNNPVHVELKDVNYQKVAELDLTTNEYGSFSGSFIAPMGVLTGNMQLYDGHSSHSFSVEEYKRPKFEVEFKPVDGTYRLGDTIRAKGFAKAYSGAMIDGAEVKYRVVRNVNYWRWYWWWGTQPYGSPTEILNGTTTTNEKGEFTVAFNAVPDKSSNPKFLPVFNYTVYADVTDINGETRTSSQAINAGYHTMNINLGIGNEIDRNKDNVVSLTTTNLNYNKVPAKGKIKITALISPEKLILDRKISRCEYHDLSYEEFKSLFPNENYDDETNMEKWKKGKTVLETSFDTEKADTLLLEGLKNWEPGTYVAEAVCLDKWMQEVKEKIYFTVYDLSSNKLASLSPFTLKNLTYSVEPGEEAKLLVGSSHENVRAYLEWESKEGVIKTEWINLNNEQKIISFPVNESHRGNISVNITFVKNNRYYIQKEYFNVPFTNKQLEIEFETFRNKLQPGQDEEWRIKIKGKKGDKVAAEMLLTMYDASLDAFASNNYYMSVYRTMYSSKYWQPSEGFSTIYSDYFEKNFNDYRSYPYRNVFQLNWFGFYVSNYYSYGYYGGYEGDDMLLETVTTGNAKVRVRGSRSNKAVVLADGVANEEYAESEKKAEDVDKAGAPPPPPPPPAPGMVEQTKNLDGRTRDEDGNIDNSLSQVKARTNLGETAFFFPQMETDNEGNLVVKFKMPESLTKWKVLGISHTKDLKIGTITKELVTQKELMVVPNMPRFLREDDKITLTAKITNLSDADLSGKAQLVIIDAITQKPLADAFQLKNDVVSFSTAKKQSTAVSWNIYVPLGVEAITWKVVAKANNFSDGEESALPVLSNRMLVTESMPLHIRKKGTKEFNFQKLIGSKSSSTLKNYKLTLEYTSNPAWYAVQSLPYLMEYPHECAEQTFSRFYANSIASSIANSNPKIKAVFDAWKNSSPESFLSNLEKNQELKAVVLEETPWVLEAKSESERKKRVGLLFDFVRMSDELERAIKKLEKMQAYNGGFPWFPGMPESRYITQHIVTGMGKLDRLGVKKIREDEKVWRMVRKAVDYLDHEFKRDFQDLKRYNKNYLKEQTIGYYQVQYLYARSYFTDLKISGELKEAVDYYIKQEQKYWLQFNLFSEAMIALTLHRYKDTKTTVDIIKSLKERSLYNEEMGRYWKENTTGYYWYEAPIETQAMMIEAFDEAANDLEMVDDLKVWLLKNKQTNAWQTTKATTEACYALLMRGTDVLSNDEPVEVELGGKKINPKEMDVKTEAGTGYYKVNWSGDEIKPEMGKVKITSSTNSVSWGALHWQYFENLDKITGHETPVKIKKDLFVVENTASGPVISPIKNKLKIGDLVRVRIEIRVDRQLEFVHLKDMRASGFEPVNVMSRYKYKDGLGYYESTRDAATNFFFDNIGKGTYVFEYDLRVAHSGDFSNGIASMQCMYAPEFNSHSNGIRVVVNSKK